MPETMRSAGDAIGQRDPSLFYTLSQDIGKLAGARQRSEGFAQMHKHFRAGRSRSSLVKIISQAVSGMDRQMLHDRPATLGCREMDAVTLPIDVAEAKPTDLDASHAVGAQQGQKGTVTQIGCAIALDMRNHPLDALRGDRTHDFAHPA